MTQHRHLDPSAFWLPGDDKVGALLVHGFTGSPTEMRPLGDYLNSRGMTVLGPRLPGHGTDVREMNRCSWIDWARHVEAEFEVLLQRCDQVFVAGLSMGALLTANLAARRDEVAGVALLSPALQTSSKLIWLTPLAKYLVTSVPKTRDTDLADPEADLLLWCYDENPLAAAHELLRLEIRMQRLLPHVLCPALVIYSTRDQAIHARSAPRTYDLLATADKQLVTLHGSGHCITVDAERDRVCEEVLEFFSHRSRN